jgi:glutathione S-transferase
MIVYGNSLSPFVRKVMVFAAEKGVPLDVAQTFPGDEDPAFRAMSPFGKVPAFSDGEYTLCDSSAIVQYIEAKHPSPALIPGEAKARGRTIWFEEFADTILLQPVGKIFFNRVVAKLLGRPSDLSIASDAQETELPPILAWLETQIPGASYLVGDAFSLADIAVCTMLVNLGHAGVAPEASAYPKLVAYRDTIFARPSFAPIIAAERKILGLAS